MDKIIKVKGIVILFILITVYYVKAMVAPFLPPLHISAKDESLADINNLLDQRTDVNQQDRYGCVPLHWAALNANVPMIKRLIEAKAKINIKDNDGCTPLHKASLWNQKMIPSYNEKAVQKLICAGADLYTQNNKGNTATYLAHQEIKPLLNEYEQLTNQLFCALQQKDKQRTRTLLVKKIAHGTRNDQGNTPLHLAVRNGWDDITRMLILKGADPSVQNNKGETPISMNPHFWLNAVFGSEMYNEQPSRKKQKLSCCASSCAVAAVGASFGIIAAWQFWKDSIQ